MFAPRRQKRGLVDEVGQVGPDHPRSAGRDTAEIDVRRERHAARVHPEDLLAASAVGWLHGDAAVEASGAKQRLVEHLRAVGRADDDHAGRRVEAVHLGQDLVQRLLALVVAAAEARDPGGARTTDGVELVDEDDRRRRLLGLREEVAHPRGADADDRLDELRGGQGEEGHVRLPRHRPSEQRLAGAGRADEQHTARDAASEPSVLVRAAQEVDDLDQLRLRLFDAGDVGERHPVAGWLVAACARAAECPERALALPARRRKKTRSPTRRSVGPKPMSSVCHQGGPVSSGSALTTTSLLSSSAESASVSAKAGISVSNFFAGSESP